MSQYPNELPEGLRKLFDAVERGEAGEPPQIDFSQDFTKVTEPGGVPAVGGDTNALLREILDELQNLPDAIWDAVEGR